MRYLFLFTLILFFSTACNLDQKQISNPFEGKLNSTYDFSIIEEKSFLLDSLTGQKNQYSQLYLDDENRRIFSFLNYNTKTIYFYNYDSAELLETLKITQKDSSIIKYITAYFVKSKDSIFFHDDINQKILLLNKNKELKDSLSLIANMNPNILEWTLKYPQYNPTASSPMFYSKQGLIYTGQYMWAIPKSIIKEFKFTALIDLKNRDVKHLSNYPESIYGGNTWDDPIFTTVYSDLDFVNNTLIYSFPTSHDIYILNLLTNEQKVFFGGSNLARTITSIPKMKKGDLTYREKLKTHIVKTDLYGGIKYDVYNKFYYRFLRQGIQDFKANEDWKDKPLSVIIYDDDFNFIGEKVIGKTKEWNWENSYVTKEGLNIEYIEQQNNDETKLTFKIFKPIKK